MSAATPKLVYRRQDVAAAVKRAAGRGLRLRLAGPHAAAVAAACGVDAVAVLGPHLPDAPADVLATSPPADAAAAGMLAASDLPPLLTVDHFAHVELIAAEEWREPPRLLIELSLGPTRFGGRPGRDAVDLAGVIAGTAGVQFGGLSAAVSSTGMADSLLRTAEQIGAAGVAVPLISAAAGPEEMDGLPSGHEVRQAVPPACVSATVLGRPSLETCVLNAGSASGLAVGAAVRLGRSPNRPECEARVRGVEGGRSLLTIPAESVEALIGDEVFVYDLEDARADAAAVV